MNYESQRNWLEIQAFLPEEMQFNAIYKPVEETWLWEGHQVHLDRFRNSKAKVKVILFHGLGTNGRQMSTILGGPLWKHGYETVAIDMPGYGMTEAASGALVTYEDWVNLASDFINTEMVIDSRPIVLYGLSAGGMLAYHVAAINKKVKGIVGMAFLDQREQQVRDETAYNPFFSRVSVPLVNFTARIPLFSRLKVPMSLAGKMYALVNNKAALKAFMKDKTSAGSWASMKFLSSYLTYKPAVEPEDFDVCPILHTQPAEDRWTPLRLSEIFLKRMKRVPTKVVMLENAGHYPIEQPGLDQMQNAIEQFLTTIQL